MLRVVTCSIVRILAHSSLCQEQGTKLAAVVHVLLNVLQNMPWKMKYSNNKSFQNFLKEIHSHMVFGQNVSHVCVEQKGKRICLQSKVRFVINKGSTMQK